MKLEEYFGIKGTYEYENGVFNVQGSIKLTKIVDRLPFKFGKVTGNFLCDRNKLITLEGCPTHVGGIFFCDNLLKNTKEYKSHLIKKKFRGLV